MDVYTIKEITQEEYQTSNIFQRIIESREPNYFYELEIGNALYYIDSNSDSSNFCLQHIDETSDLIFANEDRIYIYSTQVGKVKFATRTFDPVLAIRILDGFYIIFTEKMMFTFLADGCMLLASNQFSDMIEDIKIEGRNIEVNCFDGNTFKVKI